MVKDKANRPQWGSEHVRALRQHLGLTQRELADALGTRQQTISEWEKGMYQPRGASSTLLSIVAERADFEYNDATTPITPKPPRFGRPFNIHSGVINDNLV
jgi:DNA-binding XRE family transcriptional regulator